MTEWYYAAGGTEQVGPVPAERLVALLQAGTITADTLVWRTGLDSWQPLQRSFEELGVRAAPPLPPALPPAPPPVPATVPRPGIVVHHAPTPKPGGMSGCLIAAIVVAVLAVPMIAILAAIALPAYNNYRVRSAEGACLAEMKAYANSAVAAMSSGESPGSPPHAACSEVDAAVDTQTPITGVPKAPGKNTITCEMQTATCSIDASENTP
ncbi:MAG TPA: DUF4339 domain-containing protein [Thermomonas sp.]|jgi:type IV pilus assembly protein PilA|nr:DUF4339 domain-containing protein [Thermomonas sp.]HQY49722.1 DUF4339 domain-containing protein [Thermomonas sp.]HRA56837.1 DUF4339 domain-containing protein [Thermomonas sp.]